jgi:hypothetical protein
MRPAGRDGDVQVGHAREMDRLGYPRHGASRPPRPRGHSLPVRRIAADGRVDAPAGLDDSPDERDVLLVDLTIAKLPRQLFMRAIVFGDDHDS